MAKLLTKEKLFALKLKSNDIELSFAFNRLLDRFSDDDEKNLSNHCSLIKFIYFENVPFPMWKVASLFHISERTLFRYRNDYLSWIDFFIKKYRKLNVPKVV